MKMRKMVVALLLALLTIGSCASAMAAEATVPALPVEMDENSAAPHVEETVWYERYYQGRWQKRLWSITNECWLTDWIDIDIP